MKTAVLRLRCTPAEKVLFQKAAQLAGARSLSQWILDLAVRRAADVLGEKTPTQQEHLPQVIENKEDKPRRKQIF